MRWEIVYDGKCLVLLYSLLKEEARVCETGSGTEIARLAL